jgi:translation initiation factor eIF-2B subunit delta
MAGGIELRISAGKKLLTALSSAGIPCTYLLLPAIGTVIAEVSTVFIGAHSLHSNGAVHSRAGTALVSMMAKQHSIPVVVCCETYKISETVQLDSFTKNELGTPFDVRLKEFSEAHRSSLQAL